MSEHRESRWPTIIFLSTCGIFFLGCVWYLWAGTLNPDYYWRRPAPPTAGAADPVLEKNGRVLLVKDQGARVGDTRIVYRGSHDGTLRLECFVLQLDPHYGYPQTIDEDQARKGFFMGEHYFKVVAASADRISLKRLT